MKQEIIKKINMLYEYSNLLEVPNIVFVTPQDEGFLVEEQYMLKDATGKILKGIKRKTFEVTDLSEYDSPQYENTIILLEGVSE